MKLAILLYGRESEKPVLKTVMENLQNQLNNTGSKDAEVLFNINDEASVEELKEWLLSQTTAKKYVFITAKTELPDNFIIYRLNRVKNGAKTDELVELGVYSKL